MKRMGLAAGLGLAFAMTAAAQTPQKAPDKESWTYMAVKGGAMGWETANVVVDKAKGTRETMRFAYYSTPQTQQGKTFRWIVQDVEVNCAAKTFQLLDGQFLDEDGDPIGDAQPWDKPEPLKPGPDTVIKEVLCDNVGYTGEHETDDLVKAMDAAAKIALP